MPFFIRFSDPEAHADQAREIEAVAVEIAVEIAAEMSDGDRTALIEHDSLSKSRTCPAESGTVFKSTMITSNNYYCLFNFG